MVDRVFEAEPSPAPTECSTTSYEAKVKQNKIEIEKLKRDIYEPQQPAANNKGQADNKRKRTDSEETETLAKRRDQGASPFNDIVSASVTRGPVQRRHTRANPAAIASAPAPVQSGPDRILASLLEHGLKAQLRRTHMLVGGFERPAGTRKILLCTHRLDEEFADSYGLLKKIENDAEEGGHPATKELKGEAKALAIAKSFGHIEGTDVGRIFRSREELGRYLVHRAPVAGIFGDEGIGAYSIVASGKYEDDEEDQEEKGATFFFTGEGGQVGEPRRKKKNGNLRRGAEACAQKLTKGNAALLTSCATASPIRVIRGIRLDKRDKYRYDGLYQVEEVWERCGKSGHGIYSFKLRRMPDQAPIEWVGEEENPGPAKADEGDGERENPTESKERVEGEPEGEEEPAAEEASGEGEGAGADEVEDAVAG